MSRAPKRKNRAAERTFTSRVFERRPRSDHAEELVEKEQEGELYRRIAEIVKVQENEHPESAIGQRERPIGDRDGM
jgi:hypothetical protein